MRLIDFSPFLDHKRAPVVNFFSSDFDIVLLGVGCLSQGKGGTFDRRNRIHMYLYIFRNKVVLIPNGHLCCVEINSTLIVHFIFFGPTIIVIILNQIPNIHVFYESVAVNL